MSFRFLMASIDLDGIAHGLEGMEGQSQGQREAPKGKRVGADMAKGEKMVDVLGKEVIVFEEGEGAQVEGETENEESLAFFAGSVLNASAGDIVNGNNREQNGEIGRNKASIEITGSHEQDKPASPVRSKI